MATGAIKFNSYISGSKFLAKDGVEHFFIGGILETSDEKLIAELRAAIKSGGCMIYEDTPQTLDPMLDAAADLANAAAVAAQRNAGQTVTATPQATNPAQAAAAAKAAAIKAAAEAKAAAPATAPEVK